MAPHLAHRVSLEHVRVRDCMHNGILSCPIDAPLDHVARIMAGHHVHAVAVTAPNGGRPLGIVSDLDVVAAAAGGTNPMAKQAAGTDVLTVSADASLRSAAQRMAAHGVSHLIVLDSASGYPVGIVSSLDVAAVYGGR